MNLPERALQGLTVGVSISESENSGTLGFPGWQVNRTTLQVVSALFGQGVGVVFGHDWRDDGVMEAVHGFAQEIQPPAPLSLELDEAEALRQPLLRNILPWPDVPRLFARDVERLSTTLRVDLAELPAELAPFAAQAEFADPKSTIYRYVRACGLTHLRLRLEAATAARLCIGDRGSPVVCRGIVEEALFALRASKPVFFSGLLGGAADDVINAIEGKEMPPEWCLSKDIAALYANPPIRESDPATHSDREIDPESTWSELHRLGRESISNNGLRPPENEELFHTPVLDRVIQLVLAGLSRFRALS